MKELTYEEWQKNPTPRMMWVWNEDEMYKEQYKVFRVIYITIARIVHTKQSKHEKTT